jgi:hypothetical protein
MFATLFCLVSVLIWNAPARARGQEGAAILKAPAAAIGVMPGAK